MKSILLSALACCILASAAGAQAVDAAKETGKSAVEGTKEGAASAKASTEFGTAKLGDKTSAQVHKAKAKYHRHKAKKAADAAAP